MYQESENQMIKNFSNFLFPKIYFYKADVSQCTFFAQGEDQPGEYRFYPCRYWPLDIPPLRLVDQPFRGKIWKK